MRIGKYDIRLRKPGSLIFPFIVLLFCVAYLIQSRDIFPNLTMILVRITFYAIVVFSLFVFKEEIQITTEKETDSQQSSPRLFTDKSRKIWFFIIGMGIYIVMINQIGFIFSTLLFVSMIMYMLGIREKKILILLPVCLVILIYLMFNLWLMVPLPSGILGF